MVLIPSSKKNRLKIGCCCKDTSRALNKLIKTTNLYFLQGL